jgi:hypothetical protein
MTDGRDTRKDGPDTGNKNLDLLIKLLMMTTSDNDNIALISIRKANAQLEKFNADWESLLRGRVSVVADPFNGMAKPSVESRPAPKATPPAPAPTPPRPRAPTPPPRPAPHPMHQTTTAAPKPFTPFPNRYDTHCLRCLRPILSGEGLVTDKINGHWQVECAPGKGCKTPRGQKAPPKPSLDPRNITNLI